MAQPDQIADLIATAMRGPQGPDDSGFHIGTVLSWNTLTGENIIEVQGQQIPNLRTLSSGIGIKYTAGETVVLIRKQTQWFILGKVGAVGGAVGSSLNDSQTNFLGTFGTSGSWNDLPTGPVTSTVNIGSSRSALVFWRCNIKVRVGDTTFGANIYDPSASADVSFAVSGASSIAAGFWAGQQITLQGENYNTGGGGRMVAINSTVSGFMPVAAQHGLNKGQNTFSMKFRSSQTAEFFEPGITVLPL